MTARSAVRAAAMPSESGLECSRRGGERRTRTDRAHRIVRLTARASALLFAASQATAALDPASRRLSRPLYLAFMTAHATHFAAVTRYAVLTGGSQLFPGGRGLSDVGGWPTLFGSYGAFAGLTLAGLAAQTPGRNGDGSQSAVPHRGTSGVIAAMFVGTYAGQMRRSPAYGLLAGIVAAPTAARVLGLRLPARQAPGRRPR